MRSRGMISWLITILALLADGAWAAERILSYHSDISIKVDGSMVVEERIAVRAEGRQISRGIYRDFPTRYRDRFGNAYVVDFDVVSVRRDGGPEAWHTESMSNGVRLYVGSADRRLQPGEYEYSIRYRTSRQLGFFPDHDELYWNVTGNGWTFGIDQASATVRIPGRASAESISVEGYTGAFGASGRNYESSVTDGRAEIRTVQPLTAGEGLTLVVSFPKGLVAEPSMLDRLTFLLTDNLSILLALIALLGSAGYLYLAWRRIGRDPEAGVIFAHYEPPEGYSPASARYIMKMGYDASVFSAAVINLAVKGHLRIHCDGDDYSLHHNRSDVAMAPGEAALHGKLFSKGLTLELDNKNHKVISAARKAHRRALQRNYLNLYFRNNHNALVPSALGSLLALALAVMAARMTPVAIAGFALTVLVHVLFAYLLKSPTSRGRSLLDKLEGFKLYLNVAEQQDLNLRHPPEKTPELFERYLPFAVALGVEQAWADQFTEVFARLAEDRSGHYQPGWYSGDFNGLRLNSFASDLGSSFTSAISSAGSPPGSSSGGGGGGFSGGGGGGGGGGGW